MTRTALFATMFVAFAASAAALGISATVDTPRTLMSREDYQDAKRVIEAATRAAVGQCRALRGVDRDICKAQARGEERVKVAQLQARYHGTVAAASEVEIARVRAHYDLERARCGARDGDGRLQCLRAAREGRTREIGRAKLASTT